MGTIETLRSGGPQPAQISEAEAADRRQALRDGQRALHRADEARDFGDRRESGSEVRILVQLPWLLESED